MRTEQEMMDLILKIARNDERIRAVYMNGSRTNLNVPKDIFQDYDLVFVVTETASFICDKQWINVFGQRLYMQLPEEMNKINGGSCDFANSYGYLIQLADGNRIDLHLQSIEYSKKDIFNDKLCVVLMDKDNLLPQIPQPTDCDYWVKKPTQAAFSCCCNEFWWLMNNVAKGLWREEIPYVMDMLNIWVRPELVTMLSWQAGVLTDFSVSVGKSGKYLLKFLPEHLWKTFLKTYPPADISKVWESVFIMCDLFEQTAQTVAASLGLCFDRQEAQNSIFFLNNAFGLPKDAKEVL